MKTQGVVLLCFDLPASTSKEKSDYRQFVKSIKSDGYIPLQKSIYIKQIGNIKTKQQEIKRLYSLSHGNGTIYALVLSREQFERMYIVSGDKPEITFERIIIIGTSENN